MKRYTTLGMAPDQGKNSNVAALAVLADADRARHRRDRHHHLPPALRAGLDRGAGGRRAGRWASRPQRFTTSRTGPRASAARR